MESFVIELSSNMLNVLLYKLSNNFRKYINSVLIFGKNINFMSHDNHNNNHDHSNEFTFFDGGGVSAVGFIFVILGLLVLAWLMIAG